MERRRSKKSESIEVRLTLEDKQALMRNAASQGRSASEIVRDSIATYSPDAQSRSRRLGKWGRGAALLLLPAFVIAVSYSLSSPASGDPDYRHAFLETLARLDKNRDGTIDRHEFAAQTFLDLAPSGGDDGTLDVTVHRPPNFLDFSPDLRGEFAAEDGDGDGRITLAEYVAYRHALAHRQFATLDADSNGRISLAEFRRQLGVPAREPGRKLFASKDSNHDGWLSEQELDH